MPYASIIKMKPELCIGNSLVLFKVCQPVAQVRGIFRTDKRQYQFGMLHKLFLAYLKDACKGIIYISEGFGMYVIDEHAIFRQFADAMDIGTQFFYLFSVLRILLLKRRPPVLPYS